MAVLLENAANPQILFQSISASARAKHAFDHQPTAYLKISISILPSDLRQLIVAYMALANKSTRFSYQATRNGPTPSLEQVGRAKRHGTCWCSGRQSQIADFLDQYFTRSEVTFPPLILDPVVLLMKTATVYEAIDRLSTANIWTVKSGQPQMHKVLIEGLWAISPGRIQPVPFDGDLHRIGTALWLLEVFCCLFGRGCSVDFALFPHSRDGWMLECGKQMDQCRFFHSLSEARVQDLARVYDDISRMLESVYSRSSKALSTLLGMDFQMAP